MKSILTACAMAVAVAALLRVLAPTRPAANRPPATSTVTSMTTASGSQRGPAWVADVPDGGTAGAEGAERAEGVAGAGGGPQAGSTRS